MTDILIGADNRQSDLSQLGNDGYSRQRHATASSVGPPLHRSWALLRKGVLTQWPRHLFFKKWPTVVAPSWTPAMQEERPKPNPSY